MIYISSTEMPLTLCNRMSQEKVSGQVSQKHPHRCERCNKWQIHDVCWLTIVDIYVWPSKFHAQSYYMHQKNKEQIIDYANVTFHSNVLIHRRWCNYPYCQSLLLSHEALGCHHGTCHRYCSSYHFSATIEVNSQCLHKQLCGNTWLMIEITT